MKLSINSANMKVYDNNNYSESLLQSYHSSASDGASNGSHSLLTPSASSPMSTDEDDAKTAAPKYRSQMTLSQAVQMPLVINLELSKSEVNFLQIATKMTVLSTIMTTSSVAVLVDASVSAFYGEKWLGGFLWYFGAMLGLMIDSTVNVFCVYLSLPYPSSRKMYNICCKPTFHACCYKLAKKRLQQQKLNRIVKTEMANI